MSAEFLNKLLIPFAIIHLRIIQYRYRKISMTHDYNRTNVHCNTLRLLQAKEYYYEQCFSPWGRFNPKFAYSKSELARQKKFMLWLFPEKEFKEWDCVITHNPRAVTYYHNKIFKLQKGASTLYAYEIPKQLREWKKL